MTRKKRHARIPLSKRIFAVTRGFLIAIGLAVTLPILTWKWSLPRLGELLITDDHPSQHADFIVIMMGEATIRPS